MENLTSDFLLRVSLYTGLYIKTTYMNYMCLLLSQKSDGKVRVFFHLIYGKSHFSVSFARHSAHEAVNKNSIYGSYGVVTISEVGWEGVGVFSPYL